MHFTRQLAVFVKAGIPITEAMQIIGDETQDVALQRTITMMVDDLRNGGTLSEAAAKHPEAFPNYYIGIMQSAELTGKLDETLENLSHYLERELETRSKVVRRLVVSRRRHGDGDVHGGRPGRLRAAAVQAAVRGARRRPAVGNADVAVRRHAVQHVVVHPVQRVLRLGRHHVLAVQDRHRSAGEGQAGPADPGHQGHRRIRDPRAVLPHPGGDGQGRRAACPTG